MGGEETTKEVKDFIKENLKADIGIEEAWKIGDKRGGEIVVAKI